MPRLLTDSEIAWYENNIARQSAIGRRCELLAEIENDPDVLELILEVKRAADTTRVELIEKMKQLRSERREG